MVITIAAQKGGVGKTTTAAALAQALTFKGYKTLVIDADAQENLTLIYGLEEPEPTLYDLITGKCNVTACIKVTKAGQIIPGSPELDNLTVELSNAPGRDSYLRKALEPIRNKFDYIIIDTAPGLGTCLIQALTAADKVIIPLSCDTQALNGLHKVVATISEVKAYCNHDLEISGVVITQYQPQTILAKQFDQLISEQCTESSLYLAKTRIRKAIAIQESQALRENLYSYAPKSNPAIDYMNLLKELKEK